MSLVKLCLLQLLSYFKLKTLTFVVLFKNFNKDKRSLLNFNLKSLTLQFSQNIALEEMLCEPREESKPCVIGSSSTDEKALKPDAQPKF